jgi:hypothetical protein
MPYTFNGTTKTITIQGSGAVEFTANDGSIKRATVLRLNKKTTSLLTDDAQNWKVSPAMLRKLTAAE